VKKQRIQNPRFLAALGALGFLGLLGFDNPAVQQWAKLSWFSVLSLLVLLPTVDVNSKWANYRLHPRRKWMLVFLPFLGFLGFLGTEYDALYGLAFLAMTSQFAIDHKNKRPVPVKELVPIFGLLFVAIIVPLGGMLWFMTAAVRNEQMAVRQRLTEVYESQLNAAVKGLEDSVGRQRTALAGHMERSPARRFDALVRESFADSIIVLDENGSLAYPANTEMPEGNPPAKASAIQAQVRNQLRAGSVSNALEKIEHMAADETLRDARDESGRLILPALQLFCLQSIVDDASSFVSVDGKSRSFATKLEASSTFDSLQETVTDYAMEMPSSRRLFYLQELARLGAEVEPWLSAEALTTELEGLELRSQSTGYWPVPGKELHLLFSEDHRTAAVFRNPDLLVRLQEQIRAVSTVEGILVVLEREQGESWLSSPVPVLGGAWFLNLYLEDDDPFASTADRRIVRYIWTGMAIVMVMGFSFMLLARSLLAQQRLTRMKNDFVATVTHELKTPLASTRLFVDTLLEGRCHDEAQQREYLELIARENKRLSRLIDNFLTFSRMERNKRTFRFEDVAPDSIANHAADAVRENYECSDCKVKLDVADDLPPIVADEDSMITVLLNLLDNACKYSEGEKCIELNVYEKEHAVCFQVKDNGIGIAKRELSKILERFYQVDQSLTRKVGGSGLGLSIVNFIVDAHGGEIDIQSELGKGSVFTVKIPLNGGSHGK